jgi:threonine synthase
MSYLTELECSNCGKKFDPYSLQSYCPDCKATLVSNYDLEKARKELDRDAFRVRKSGMWRWRELLPVFDAQYEVTLGEGDAPLTFVPRLGAQLGLKELYVKDESFNPTGTFKARGISAAVSKAKELGVTKIVIPTAGNAGGAAAAYAARAGISAKIIMPKDTPRANMIESRITGAGVILVDGLIDKAAALAAEFSRNEGWFDISTFKEPYRVEGKKIMGYELAEYFDWELPDVIIYPTGGGTGLVGMWKAFAEMEKLGWLKKTKRPRMVVAQSDGCAPVVKAFNEGSAVNEYWQRAKTKASGLRVPKSFADKLIMKTLYESSGIAEAVSDDEIIKFQGLLASKEGIFAAPEGAATVAVLHKLINKGLIKPDERVVIFNTGSGLKYLEQ